MIRGLCAGGLGLLLMAGCGDARRPAVRGRAVESDSPSASPAETRDFFHGMPHGVGASEPLGPEVELGEVFLTAAPCLHAIGDRNGRAVVRFELYIVIVDGRRIE